MKDENLLVDGVGEARVEEEGGKGPSGRDEGATTSSCPVISQGSNTWVLEVTQPGRVTLAVLREGERREMGARGAGGAIVVEDPAVSGRHAEVRVRNGRLEVEDLGSRNGLWIGGGMVTKVLLERAGAFVVGRSVVTCSAQREDETAGLLEEPPIEGMVGVSLPMRRLAKQIRRFAALKAPVLVRGETGAGKELVAQALHRLSTRANRPFLALNMGALPAELVDAELFGHERGAFTGATVARAGAFETARGGTLFLDEVAELPLVSQAKLLRALEGGEVRAIGSQAAKRVDVRVVAATWAPLEEGVAAKAFREDLFHRLAVLQVQVPALRERTGDIGPLASRFLASMGAELGERVLTSGALSRLTTHRWPGNVRELRNVLLRAAVATTTRFISTEHVEVAIGAGVTRVKRAELAERRGEAKAVLEAHGGNVSQAARALGVSRSTIRAWAR